MYYFTSRNNFLKIALEFKAAAELIQSYLLLHWKLAQFLRKAAEQ